MVSNSCAERKKFSEIIFNEAVRTYSIQKVSEVKRVECISQPIVSIHFREICYIPVAYSLYTSVCVILLCFTCYMYICVCSAGVGRTGTFIAIDVQLQRMAVENTINVKEFVLKMRAQRPFMIQNTVSS